MINQWKINGNPKDIDYIQGKQNLGMGEQPARKFYAEMRRRNEFDEWGLELAGGWAEDRTWIEVVYVRSLD